MPVCLSQCIIIIITTIIQSNRQTPSIHQDLNDPYVSPTLLPSLERLAAREIMVTSGGAELMVSDIRAFARKLRCAPVADTPAEALAAAPAPPAASLASSASTASLSAAAGGSDDGGSGSGGSGGGSSADGASPQRRARRASPRLAAKARAAAAAAAAAGGGKGAGAGVATTYLEEPGRVHSWPMLMLPNLREKQEPIFEFFERCIA